jgi:hypothetical protein
MLMFLPTIGLFLYCLLSDNLYSGTEILIGGIVMIQLLMSWFTATQAFVGELG